MRILQISAFFPKTGENLYSALAKELVAKGHQVTALIADADASEQDEAPHPENGFEALRIRGPQIYGVSKVRKGIGFLTLPSHLKRAVRRHLHGRQFDMIVFQTPPLTLWSVAGWCMRYFRCPAYLMQKDIFPQGGVDLGYFSRNSLPYHFFRWQELRMLRGATWVGCTSEANVRYLRKHNPGIDPQKFEYFPNALKVQPLVDKREAGRRFRDTYGIPQQACVFLFAGNLGVPQNLGLLCKAISHFREDAGVFFIVIGKGNEQGMIKTYIAEHGGANARFFDFLPKQDYDELAMHCDVGIISLDPRFTIPNNPAKTLSYMELAMPILAATDLATDTRELLTDQADCGLWVDATRPADFFAAISTLAADTELRRRLGANGRRYMAEHFDVSVCVKILEEAFARHSGGTAGGSGVAGGSGPEREFGRAGGSAAGSGSSGGVAAGSAGSASGSDGSGQKP